MEADFRYTTFCLWPQTRTPTPHPPVQHRPATQQSPGVGPQVIRSASAMGSTSTSSAVPLRNIQ